MQPQRLVHHSKSVTLHIQLPCNSINTTMALLLRKSAVAVGTQRPTVARPSVVCNYKVTLKTPSGTQTIECADDVYILVRS